jgi:predicted transcriptional regulator YdeE
MSYVVRPGMTVTRTLIVIAALALASTGFADGQRPTTDEKESSIHYVNVASFTAIGIQARTTNTIEATPEGIIGKQWQKFFGEGIGERIPDRVDSNVYAVYSDYASDHNGEYSFFIGAKVKDRTAPPAGMVVKRVLAGKYAVITSEKGPFPKVVPAAWQKIFRLEDEGKLKRAYQFDFELYDPRARDPQNGPVDIYIGLK